MILWKTVKMTSKKPHWICDDPYEWHSTTVSFQGYRYSVSEIVEKSKQYEVQNCPIDAISIRYDSPCDSLASFIEKAHRVANVDTSFPIILSPEGDILDGIHRMCRLYLDGAKTVNFIRLREMPTGMLDKDEE